MNNFREILEIFSGKEKLYKKVLEFFKEKNIEINGKRINEEIILKSYVKIFNELNGFFKIDFEYSKSNDDINNLCLFKCACENRIKVVADSIFELIKNIYTRNCTYIIKSERFKNYESIFLKNLFSKNVNCVSDIHDYFGIRFTVPDTNPELCYKIFEIINILYIPYGLRYKDFIPMPNQIGYQTLQWTSIVPELEKIEFQIRTQNMADINDVEHDEYKDRYLEEENLNKNYLNIILKL